MDVGGDALARTAIPSVLNTNTTPAVPACDGHGLPQARCPRPQTMMPPRPRRFALTTSPSPLSRVCSTAPQAMTRSLCTLAEGRVVLALEGGYNVDVIAECAEACLAVLVEQPAQRPRTVAGRAMPSAALSALTRRTLQEAATIQGRYWSCLRGAVLFPQEESVAEESQMAERVDRWVEKACAFLRGVVVEDGRRASESCVGLAHLPIVRASLHRNLDPSQCGFVGLP